MVAGLIWGFDRDPYKKRFARSSRWRISVIREFAKETIKELACLASVLSKHVEMTVDQLRIMLAYQLMTNIAVV